MIRTISEKKGLKFSLLLVLRATRGGLAGCVSKVSGDLFVNLVGNSFSNRILSLSLFWATSLPVPSPRTRSQLKIYTRESTRGEPTEPKRRILQRESTKRESYKEASTAQTGPGEHFPTCDRRKRKNSVLAHRIQKCAELVTRKRGETKLGSPKTYRRNGRSVGRRLRREFARAAGKFGG